MTKSKTEAEIAALRAAALDDLMATTDVDLRQESLEEGDNLDVIAEQVKSTMREAAAEVLRQRLAQAKDRSPTATSALTRPLVRPSLERIKRTVQYLFQRDQSLGLA